MSGLVLHVAGQPPFDDDVQRRRVQVVELVAALPTSGDQSRAFEHIEVLGDGLARGAQSMLGGQGGAQLEQGLSVSLRQLVNERAPGRVGEGLKHVAHSNSIGK
jgi:hypothetical protein